MVFKIECMKKAFGILFLLLATVVILAHAFIPHHHHDRIVVSISHESFIDRIFKHHHHHAHSHDHNHSPVSLDQEVDNSHSPVSHDHEDSNSHSPVDHDHEDEHSEDCLLDDLYLRLKQSKKQQLAHVDLRIFKNIAYVKFIVATPALEIEIKDYGELLFIGNPDIPATFLSQTGQSICFRGPPEC
jgi:hypothetical protein